MPELYPETLPLAQGYLPEEDGHAIFWETFGTPGAPAIVLLHGGPGSGTSPAMPRLFDPAHWHIVTLDQRGAGRSTPHAGDTVRALHANTLAKLVHDIIRLRAHLGVEHWHVYGASFGATLAQAYAHAEPDRVAGLILASVTTNGAEEIQNLYGDISIYLPDAFEAFCGLVPEAQSGQSRAAAYNALLTCGAPETERAAARAWNKWEAAVLEVDPRAEPSTRFEDPRFALGFARVVTHYFGGDEWLSPSFRDAAPALAHIPAVLINSRADLSCPLITAWRLHQIWPKSKLIVVPGALHGTVFGPLRDEIIAAGQRVTAQRE